MPDHQPISVTDTKSERACFPTRVWWMLGLALFAIASGGGAMRIVPGGPFFSIGSDVLPSFAALVAIAIGITVFRTRNAIAVLLAGMLILVACSAITNVVTDVLQFWFRRAARGDLFGW